MPDYKGIGSRLLNPPGPPEGHGIEVIRWKGDARKLVCKCGWEKRCTTFNVNMHKAFHYGDARRGLT